MVRLAFYKGKGGLPNGLIRWWSNSEFSHVELVFSNGTSWSSSFMDKGIRFKKIEYSNPDNWDFLELPVNLEEETLLRSKCKVMTLNNAGYAYRDILGFVLRPMRNQQSKFFCSEAVLYAIQVATGYFAGFSSDKTSPEVLFQLIVSTLNTHKLLPPIPVE